MSKVDKEAKSGPPQNMDLECIHHPYSVVKTKLNFRSFLYFSTGSVKEEEKHSLGKAEVSVSASQRA